MFCEVRGNYKLCKIMWQTAYDKAILLQLKKIVQDGHIANVF